MEPDGRPFESKSIGKDKYNLISVWFNKISKIILCIYETGGLIQGVIIIKGISLNGALVVHVFECRKYQDFTRVIYTHTSNRNYGNIISLPDEFIERQLLMFRSSIISAEWCGLIWKTRDCFRETDTICMGRIRWDINICVSPVKFVI